MMWRLPNAAYRWAYPRGSHHQLIQAAIGGDLDVGRDAASWWLSENNIDDASFRDQRLLLAVIGRFGNQLSEHQAYPRLVGLQKLLWSRSLLSFQEAKPALLKISSQGQAVMVIKGAARLAAQPESRKTRVAWDIDVVVQDMRLAFEALVSDGWQPSPGVSRQYVRCHLESILGINFFKGDYGDIDLHRRSCRPGQGEPDADERLWARATTKLLGGVPLQTPAVEDRIALAIAHGGLDGHTHSDWLVDSASYLNQEPVDWGLLYDIILDRRIQVPANIMFRYFADALHLPIPTSFLKQLGGRHDGSSWAAYAGLIQSRPKDQFGPLGKLVRGVAKGYTKAKANQVAGRPREKRLRIQPLAIPTTSIAGGVKATEYVKTFKLPRISLRDGMGAVAVELVVDVAPFHGRRRLELEINTPQKHVCRIRYRRWLSQEGAVRLKIYGNLSAADAESDLILVSRPSRQVRANATEQQKRQYDSVPFRVVSWQGEHVSARRAA